MRFALLVFLAGCSGCSKKSDVPPAPSPTPPTAPVTQAATPKKTPPPAVDDPAFHIKPEEATLAIDKIEAKVGTEAAGGVKVIPGTGFHMSTDYPIKLTLDAPEGVKLAKEEQLSGKGQKGDADELSEKQLAFTVKATADKPGTYEVKGWFRFGVCDKDSCRPKTQPISIAVAAN